MFIGILSGMSLWVSADLEFKQQTLTATVPPGAETYAFSFPFKNTGTAPVEITEVKNSCGCTAAKPGKLTYQPGESGAIEGSFTVGKRIGKQKVTVTVVTGGAEPSSTKLSLDLEIPQLLESTPSMLLWREGSEPIEKEIHVKLATEYNIALERVSIDSEDFDIRLEDGNEVSGKKILIKPKTTEAGVTGKVMADVIINGEIEKKYYFYALVR